jgi:ArsR family transcriptional regulator
LFIGKHLFVLLGFQDALGQALAGHLTCNSLFDMLLQNNIFKYVCWFHEADKEMPKQAAEKRLERLAKSGLRSCENISEHIKDLRGLAAKTVEPAVLKRQTRMFKALADETRLKILRLLAKREMCVCEVMAALDLTQPTASHHLRILENAGLVKDRKDGKWVFYSLADPVVMRSLLQFNVS